MGVSFRDMSTPAIGGDGVSDDVGLSDTGRTIGPNVVVNGDFSNGLTGWATTQPTSGEVAVVGGRCHVYSANGSFCQVQQPAILTIGKVYLLEFDLDPITGQCAVNDGNLVYGTFDSFAQKISFTFRATSALIQFKRAAGITEFYIDNVVIREL